MPADSTIGKMWFPARLQTKVRAHMRTASDVALFHHQVEVEVTVDGKSHFKKRWSMSVPRILN